MNEKTRRLPPGQHEIDRFPVLQYGNIIHVDRDAYILTIDGLVENPVKLTLAQVKQLPRQHETVDIHCVTSWSKLDMKWAGVPFKEIIKLVKPKATARYVIMHCADDGFTTSLPIEVMSDDDVLVADEYDGAPITDSHGGPIRTVVPKKYFYKSAKWLVRLEFVETDQLGYWERGGYSNTADPWKEDRYAR
ncbi:MAG: molybdopterin-dependent oxidoreductase [Candidatus Lokiarchaeota archaeon]|nr:molybdopterin-dependent oxidoreductase [Candidatus Lokiarchaeota archaeon]